MKETQLIESKEMRDSYIGRYDILDKVKDLLLLPDGETATIKQIAEYYSSFRTSEEKSNGMKDIVISESTIQKIYQRNKDEFSKDGIITKRANDFLNWTKCPGQRGSTTMKFDDGKVVVIPNSGFKVFPKRAILRIGMLLTGSEVALEIRTQLLNIEEKSSDELKVKDINEEQTLMLNIGMAYASGNVDAIMKATTEYNAFQNRHIKRLENDNKALAKGILEWEDRKKLNAGMRRLAGLAGKDFAVMWNELYKNLLYKYGISLKQRGDRPYINHIAENEWNSVLKVFAAMCEAYGQSPTEIFQTTPMDNLVLHN